MPLPWTRAWKRWLRLGLRCLIVEGVGLWGAIPAETVLANQATEVWAQTKDSIILGPAGIPGNSSQREATTLTLLHA
jgi:hypothetical protein